MRFAHRQRSIFRQGLFRRFDVRKEIVVSQQMPDRVWSVALNGQDPQQSEGAFELKNQVVPGIE